MGKIKKKGESGQAKNFITRTQAVRKLQISLPEFRKLCIFKGIYPREPRNKKKASKSSTPSTTFYYTKDIQYLLHEPILQKYRDHKALAKKIGRHLGRNEASDAARLEKTQKPRVRLDHIIKERYPTFVDALRDLDDALSMIFLFANLPSQAHVDHKKIALCQRLAHEFEHYLIISHTLRKSFLSIKGIYYQATIQGQDILWLVPYKFVQRVSGDVDFRIMDTFLEFYTTLLGFVNYRLYSSIGLIYPPKFNTKSDEAGGELGAYTLEGQAINGAPPKPLENGTAADEETPAQLEATKRAQDLANVLRNAPATPDDRASTAPSEPADDITHPSNQNQTSDEIDRFPTESTSSDFDILPQPGPSSNEAATLFADTTFFISREAPRAPLEFLLRAFGCRRVGWDVIHGDGSFTNNEADSRITHQVVDRPMLATTRADPEADTNGESAAPPRPGRYPNRTYMQPQWVWDCVNNGKLLSPAEYGPGATLPPHLSPFVKPREGVYDPTRPLERTAEEDEQAVDGAESDGTSALENGIVDEIDEDMVDDEDRDGAEDASASSDEELANEANGFDALAAPKKPRSTSSSTGEDDFAGFSSDDEDTRRQAELEAEARGEAPPKTSINKPLKSALKKPTEQQKAAREKQEQVERQMMMMPRRKRKLMEKMQYSNARKDEERERLEAKRRRIDRQNVR